ncbi:Holliday junction branch migration protein RuvA [Oceanobacillus arenosus]|uniref:Holliday junction branch migration complex subunit RuvA n=1 Tax=Oceanobacillus arenosus TaxID=1229153 RepID=A0A3D8PVX8_9BACI|nr:Holliday junction branch migration protein RuvA [Oceanobacillus arenosus]RDW19299.1 Holliday junction branch migration protein RuvA [Oceanobacillus arenosus]
MIAYIKGILTNIQDESLILDVHGVGYELICANPFAFQSKLNEEVLINTYQYVREDTLVLYGFKNEDEKYLFKKLISVSGIGPKGALAILASVDIPGFVSAVEREDDKFLTSFPGVGKKTARQIILDLKGKLVMELSISMDQNQDNTPSTDHYNTFAIADAQEALKALGYMDREIKAVIPKLQAMDIQNTDEIIKNALALLMKK